LLRAVEIPAAGDPEGIERETLGALPAGTERAAGTISMSALDRMARATGCKLVYATVPQEGKTLGVS